MFDIVLVPVLTSAFASIFWYFREKARRPFRCLDCQYRRELVRVYLSNVELICRRFVEEKRGALGKLIEDKVRWSRYICFAPKIVYTKLQSLLCFSFVLLMNINLY